jgi:acetyl-CoA carboxylase biotin carboxyl carrier protein
MSDEYDSAGRGLPPGLTDDIAALAAVMTEHGLGKIQINVNGLRVVLSAPTFVAPSPSPPATVNLASDVTDDGEIVPNGNTSGFAITSPMIGTYYTAPRPGDEPFVRVGDLVVAGQTVAIIEAMKIMNEIQAERGGIVEELLVSNGQPVEYNQPLIRLT